MAQDICFASIIITIISAHQREAFIASHGADKVSIYFDTAQIISPGIIASEISVSLDGRQIFFWLKYDLLNIAFIFMPAMPHVRSSKLTLMVTIAAISPLAMLSRR